MTIDNESEVTYQQYNWLVSKEDEAEKAGLVKADAIMSSDEFRSQFHDRLTEFLRSWSAPELQAFAAGELSEMYLKPVLAYFWDLNRPVVAGVTASEAAEQGLSELRDVVNQKLQTLFESSVWSGLLGVARVKARAVANSMVADSAISVNQIGFNRAKPDVWASLALVQQQAIGEEPVSAADQKWLNSAYYSAYAVGQKVVTSQVVTSDAFVDAVVDFVSGLDGPTLHTLASNIDSPLFDDTMNELSQTLFDKFFSSPPPISVEGGGSFQAANRDYFLRLSYEEGAKDKVISELVGEVPEYAKSAL